MICSRCDVVLTEENQPPSWRNKNCNFCKDCSKENNQLSNPDRMFINGKYIKKTHPLYKAGNYKSFGDLAFGSLNNYKQIKEGYVYAISNSAWPNWIKIGMAIDAEDRLNGYQTSSPMRDFVLEHSVASNDRRKSEKEAHTRALPLSLDYKGEWFKLSVEQAITILDNLNEYGYTRATKEANPIPKEDNIQGSLF